MEFETLSLAKRDKIAIVSLNKPETLNALTHKMNEEFGLLIEQLRCDQDIRVLILTGEGRSFCSGADMRSTFKMYDQPPAGAHQTVVKFYQTFLSIRSLEIPTIAVVKGHTIGAGVCLAMACDMIIASTDTKLAMSFIKIGINPGMGGTYLLPRLVGTAKAMELCLTGDTIDAQEALRIGLVNHVVEPEKLMDFSLALAGRIANNPPIPARFIKQAVYQGLNRGIEEEINFEAFAQITCTSTGDMQEALAAFKEKRPPVFKGI